jgi:hypothetical protein
MRYTIKIEFSFAGIFDIYLLHPCAATGLLSQKPYATVTKHMGVHGIK